MGEALNAAKTMPFAFAVILEDYARALDRIGQTGKAQEARTKAKKLRDENTNAPSDIPFKYYPTKFNP